MRANTPAPRAAAPLKPYAVKLKTATGTHRFTALAPSSAQALGNAMDTQGLGFIFGASIKPVGTPADAMRTFRQKLALAGLVE